MNKQPLADRMRPENLDEYIGQKHIVGEGRLLRRAIQADMLRSIILYGPPGCGKTSLAHVISKMTNCRFVKLNATTAKTSDVKDVIDMAKNMWIGSQMKTILFIDEIHRFNKGQQDTLLPAVEDGTIILIGATTENPNYEVNGALLSRSTIFKLENLSNEDIKEAIILSIKSPKGLREYNVDIHDDALDHIAKAANGDLRSSYNAIELAVLTTTKNEEGKTVITLEIAEESIQTKKIKYDKSGSYHYDIMSAFIKSMRASRTDAALHYFARMIEAGEDPKAIARRIIIHASEDVGMANPQALVIATSAFTALQTCGMPEARLPLAQAIIYVCESPKSNTVYNAVNSAFYDIKTKSYGDVPLFLRDGSKLNKQNFGNGEGYIYPHNIPGGWTPIQEYMPEGLEGIEYYKPSPYGHESKVRQSRKDRIDKYNNWIGRGL